MELTLVWKRNPFKSRRKSIEKAQNFIDETCVEKMTEFVPVAKPIYRNAGQLRDSVEIKEPGLIIYTAPFAKLQAFCAIYCVKLFSIIGL